MSINGNAPLRVGETKWEGLSWTQEATAERCLAPVLAAQTVAEVAQGAVEAAGQLDALGVFERVDVTVDKGPAPGVAKLVVSVKEKRVVTLKATTFVENGEGGVELAGGLRNVLGWAEFVSASYVAGGASGWSNVAHGKAPKARKTQMRVDATVPRVAGSPFALNLAAESSAVVPPPNEPYENLSHGVTATLSNPVVALDWSIKERDVLPQRDANDVFTYAAPPEILDLARPSLKSAVGVRIARDWSAPSPFAPQAGGSVLLRAEVAHPKFLGGDVAQTSASLRVKRSTPLTDTVSLSLALEGAVVRSLGSSGGGGGVVPLADRLFMGGPMGLWGFLPRGAGARTIDGRCALGGTTRWQARVALEGPPPLAGLSGTAMRTHVFLAVGALSNEFSSASLLGKDLRASVGVGFAVPLAVGRLELNAVGVLKRGAKDDVYLGRVQFGLGGEFL